jgi:hypothetical protein
VAPKGQRIEFDGIDIWSVRNGKLYEHWDEFDWPRALIELGVSDLDQPPLKWQARLRLEKKAHRRPDEKVQ